VGERIFLISENGKGLVKANQRKKRGRNQRGMEKVIWGGGRWWGRRLKSIDPRSSFPSPTQKLRKVRMFRMLNPGLLSFLTLQ
jgi:hypothetical protein